MTPLTLRTKLTLFYTGILALLLVTISVVYDRALGLQLDADVTASLRELTTGMHAYLRFEKGTPILDYDPSDPEQEAFIEEATRFYQVYDSDTGALLVQSPALEPLRLRYTPFEVKTFRDHPRVHDVQTDRGRIRFSNSPISAGPGDDYLLQVGVSLDSLDGAVNRFLRVLFWSIPAGLVVSLVTGRWMAGWALRPLAKLAAATRGINVSDLHERLPVRGSHDELDLVAEAFNDTLGRLEKAVGEMKQFSTAIAHELRTPLAALRGETELALIQARSTEDYRAGLTSQLEELDKLTRLINQLLTLARAEAGEIPLAGKPVNVTELAASVVEQLEPVAQARDIELTCGRLEQAIANGDRGWLERLLLNVLDNAIKFTEPGGRIDVSVWPDGGAARIELCDTGVGIAADALPRIFERFFRVDPARSSLAEGVGLGLTLVKWIVDRHNGSIEVTSQPGVGSTFVIRLPLA